MKKLVKKSRKYEQKTARAMKRYKRMYDKQRTDLKTELENAIAKEKGHGEVLVNLVDSKDADETQLATPK